MTVHLFVGPTLPRAEVAALCDFVCLPPVTQGDVLRSARARPQAIGIVDGCFDGVPAVWHKEILWAMTQGIHVFGSASMGALRAAELHPFGMRGVGRIFEAYRSGEIEDDDEVALLHGPAETGYVNLSEPLVNIRATLEEAERAGVIGPEMRAAVIDSARGLFYQERSWERVLAFANVDDARRLRAWLPTGQVDQKQRDARAMIATMREFLAGNPEPLRPTFKFEWTDMWDIATGSVVARGEGASGTGSPSLDEWVLDELRLDGGAFEPVRQRALLRNLARDGRAPPTRTIEPSTLREVERGLRTRLGLPRRADMERWCADNGLVMADFARLVEDEARLATMEQRLDAAIGPDLVDQLRIDGDYERFAARAREKHAVLSARGLQDATVIDCGVAPIGLVGWHFQTQRGQPIPDDLAAYARRLGLAKLADFYRVLAREWLYSHQGQVGADRE